LTEPTELGEQAPPTPRMPNRRHPVMIGAGVVAVVLGLLALALPSPYIVESPGPTFNTIGAVNDVPLIEIPGQKTYPTSGALDMTTVYMSGGPSGSVRLFEVASAWLDPRKSVTPEELVYPPGVSGEQIQNRNVAAMDSSQETSVAAALSHLNVDFEEDLSVVGFAEDAAAADLLAPDDVIESINGTAVTNINVLRDELNASGGEPVELKVLRDGEPETVQVAPEANTQGAYQLGVLLETDFEFPYDVKIQLENVVGPSAGMMFALGIVDKLTPGELTGGLHVAGTGTIDSSGNVGPIGGIEQKMYGAHQRGATVFLAPEANCGDVVGNVPDGMQVVKVATLEDAVEAVTLLGEGKDGSALPACG
jgi:PDZ domain-containing protein